MRLEGKTVLVTGGKSGLGAATARELEAAGARAVVADLPECDVTDEGAVEALIGGLDELHGAVNCAGIAPAQRTVSSKGPHDLDVFRRVVEVNLIGTFNVTRLAAARMATQDPVGDDRGVIVNTASIAAFEGQTGQVAYSASKGGVAGLTLPLARDLARYQIRAVTIAPGTFDTPMLAGLPEEVRDQLAADIPHPHRLGAPAEYGLLVRQIVENPYLNGEVVRLDGALRMKAGP